MKKNRMMRLASVLLVLVLLTTSVISGTFAKYVTTDQHTDEARVAKFGVVATVSGDLFGATYTKAADNSITTYGINEGTVSSSVGAEDFVVAPGTENKEGLNFFITGTPEVSTQVYFDAAENDQGVDYVDCDIYLDAGTYGIMVEYKGVLTKENYANYYVYSDGGYYRQASLGNFNKKEDYTFYELHDIVEVTEKYYPLRWYVDGAEVTDQQTVKTKLTALFNNKTFKPNQPLDDLHATIGWSWDYGIARTDAEESIRPEDKMDTILGNMIVKKDSSADIKVVKLSTTSANYYDVVVEEVPVKTGAANNMYVAKANNTVVACLTVAFNARLTVEQVD